MAIDSNFSFIFYTCASLWAFCSPSLFRKLAPILTLFETPANFSRTLYFFLSYSFIYSSISAYFSFAILILSFSSSNSSYFLRSLSSRSILAFWRCLKSCSSRLFCSIRYYLSRASFSREIFIFSAYIYYYYSYIFNLASSV